MKFMQVIRKIFSAIFYTAEAIEKSSKSLSNLAGIADEQTANYAAEIRAERTKINLEELTEEVNKLEQQKLELVQTSDKDVA